MNAVDRAQLLQILQGRRDLIADSWHEAIAWSSLNSSSAPEARRHLVGLTDQVIALLLAERFEPLRAEAVGTSLVHHYYPQPETLARTQQTLGSQLLIGLPAEQAAALQPRLAALLAGLAAGFLQHMRKMILAEQERTYRALFAEQKRTEKMLRDSEARYRAISELISNFAYALGVKSDGDVVYEWVTGSFVRLTGFTAEEAIARGGWPSVVHPDDVHIANNHVETLISGSPDISEFRIVTKGGEVRWVRDTGRPVWDEGRERVVRIYGAAQDITASKHMERQLLRAERLTAMGRLASALAHELNNPLQAIRSNLELVLDFDLESGEREQYLQVIRQEIDRLTELTKCVLHFAQLPEDTRCPICFGHLMEQTLTLLDAQLRRARVQVTTDFPADLPPVFVAPNQIIQVLLNLMVNAVEAMPDGGHVHAEAHVDGEMLAVSLTNDGLPIPPAYVERVFDPFFTTKPKGTGLGLAVSYSIVRKHGGTISVHNLKGDRGVTFAVKLPTSRTVKGQKVAA